MRRGDEEHWSESVDFWLRESQRLRAVAEVWQLARQRYADRLADRVSWRQRPRQVQVKFGPADDDAFAANPDEIGVRYGDVLGAAEAAVYGAVNNALRRCGTELVFLFKRGFLGRPQNLLGAIWLAFAQEVLGLVRSRQCAHCGTWFRVEHGRMCYCSKSCRQSSYYYRKRGA